MLTGEAKSFAGVAPRVPFDFRASRGRGAWVLAARWSELALDSDLEEAGFTLPGTFTDTIRTASIGLNWIPNEHAIVRHASVHTWNGDAVDLGGGSDDGEDALLVELQLGF